ncbi:hypothetical protein NE237_001593 [Protea cynaroides]|uniref:Uncharacterized protein n=1 Tax=Protea cynaroides TaxID=273540 RepID=A0A9Q0KTM3_9MAGN|nr:hypothetical protein NE237_001593 [Protea cynaroides]
MSLHLLLLSQELRMKTVASYVEANLTHAGLAASKQLPIPLLHLLYPLSPAMTINMDIVVIPISPRRRNAVKFVTKPIICLPSATSATQTLARRLLGPNANMGLLAFRPNAHMAERISTSVVTVTSSTLDTSPMTSLAAVVLVPVLLLLPLVASALSTPSDCLISANSFGASRLSPAIGIRGENKPVIVATLEPGLV